MQAPPTTLPNLVLIEGNISAGKSTLAVELGRKLGWKVFLEPAEENPYLGRFYADPPRWALVMQLWLLHQRNQTYLAAAEWVRAGGAGAILDRSIWSDWVFAECNRREGNIDGEGFASYAEQREAMLEELPLPGGVIYLVAPPEVCHARVCGRGRAGEVGGGVEDGQLPTTTTGVRLAYLHSLEACYAQLLEDLSRRGIPVHTVPWAPFGTTSSVLGALGLCE